MSTVRNTIVKKNLNKRKQKIIKAVTEKGTTDSEKADFRTVTIKHQVRRTKSSKC